MKKNPFKEIVDPDIQVPPESKEKLMSDIALIELIRETSELFSINFMQAIESFFIKGKNK